MPSGVLAFAAWSLINAADREQARLPSRMAVRARQLRSENYRQAAVDAVEAAQRAGVPATALTAAVVLTAASANYLLLLPHGHMPRPGALSEEERRRYVTCLLAGLSGPEIDEYAATGTWPDPGALATLRALQNLPAWGPR